MTALAVSRNGSGKRWSLSGAFASATGKQQQQAGGVAGVGLAGWQAKLVERARGQGYVYQQQVTAGARPRVRGWHGSASMGQCQERGTVGRPSGSN